MTANFQRILYVGDSGTGKTGSLARLLRSHRLRFIDFDNGTAIIRAVAKHEGIELAPGQLEVVSLRDSGKRNPRNPIQVMKPTAAVEMAKVLEKWPTDDSTPADWGEDTILVVDSLTRWGDAAFNWAVSMDPTSNEPRRWYSQAQQMIKSMLSLMTSSAFGAHVIVVSHVQYAEFDNTGKEVRKAGPTAVGNALAAAIPSFFADYWLARLKGSRRVICTKPIDGLALKSAQPFGLDAEYPIATGVETIWKELTA